MKDGITLANFVTETLPEYLIIGLVRLPPHSPYYSRIQSRANLVSKLIRRAAFVASFVRGRAGNFHSACLLVLRRERRAFGRPSNL